PTSTGMKFYITQLMKEKQLPVSAEVSIKEQLWQERFKKEKFLKEAVYALAKRLDMMGLVIDEAGEVYYAGAANILDWPEFYDIDVTRFVLSLFDQNPRLQEIIGRAVGTDPVHILFGEDMEFEYLKQISFVFTKYEVPPEKSGIIGVLGPARMNFPLVLPYVKYVRDLLNEAIRV
ncbi:MAG: HrcA family transcriptional regulator, partial [Patescibacteria group bacterium]